jgi:ribosomal protein L35AE/L33A
MTIAGTEQSLQREYSARSRAKILRLCVLAALFTSGTAPLLCLAQAASLTHKDAIPRTARREITDPCLGFHWQLIVDPSRAGSPGRLVLLDQEDQSHSSPASRRSSEVIRSEAKTQPLILAGARVVVHQETGVVRARLNAIALDSAGLGQRLRVRLILAPALTRNAELTSAGMVLSTLATGTGAVLWADSQSMTPLERGN